MISRTNQLLDARNSLFNSNVSKVSTYDITCLPDDKFNFLVYSSSLVRSSYKTHDKRVILMIFYFIYPDYNVL